MTRANQPPSDIEDLAKRGAFACAKNKTQETALREIERDWRDVAGFARRYEDSLVEMGVSREKAYDLAVGQIAGAREEFNSRLRGVIGT